MILGIEFVIVGAVVLLLAIASYPPPFESKSTKFQKLKKLMEMKKIGMALGVDGLVTTVTGLALIAGSFINPS